MSDRGAVTFSDHRAPGHRQTEYIAWLKNSQLVDLPG